MWEKRGYQQKKGIQAVSAIYLYPVCLEEGDIAKKGPEAGAEGDQASG